MKKNFILLCAVLFSIVVVSCKKESISTNNNNNNDTTTTTTVDSNAITGTWNFISLEVQSSSSSEFTSGTDLYESVTTANYTTINNGGKIIIDSVKFNGSNITYSVDSRAYSTIYQNGTVFDTTSMPVQTTLAPYSNSAAYTKIGTDSVYFPAGATFIGGVQGTSQPSGAKLRVAQGKLYMTQSISQTTTNPSTGQPMLVQATTVATFQK